MMALMKATSNGRIPQNIESGISQQPLIGSSSNVILKLMGPNQNWILLEIKTIANGRRPQVEISGTTDCTLIKF